LRALLEPEGPSSGMLPGRLAVLCATPERRLALTERTVQAIALERSVIAGTATAHAGAGALAEDVADNLRALLRDVICGHLDADLVGLADELLLEDAPAPQPEPLSGLYEQPEPAVAVEPISPVVAPEPEPIRARFLGSEPKLLGDPSESEEILDIFI
jgi:hypothetical protein